MPSIASFTQELTRAIEDAKRGDPWRQVTVVLPSMPSALQWRRRVARRLGSVFNVRWIELRQLIQELSAAGAASRPAVTRPMQIAAAWRAIREGPSPFRVYASEPSVVVGVVRSFGVIERLDDQAREKLTPEVRALHEIYSGLLAEFDTFESKIRRLVAMRNRTDDFILVRADSSDHLLQQLIDELHPIKTLTLPIDEVSGDHWSVHDELDEVKLAGSAIQDDGAAGRQIWDIAVTVPSFDPYLPYIESTFDEYGIPWNGASSERVRDTPAGRALGALLWSEDSAVEQWTGLVPRVESALKAVDFNSNGFQNVRDGVESWLSATAIVAEPAVELLEALREATLASPMPKPQKFGDGVFVALPSALEGMCFRKVIALGFRDKNYPRAARAAPLLPKGLGELVATAQHSRLGDLFGAQESVVFVSSRSDRRNSREAFPSPWLETWTRNRVEIPSSLAQIQRFGARCDSEQALVSALATQNLPDPATQRAATLRISGEPDWPDVAGQDLLPKAGVSPSQLETFFDCPRKWYLRYVIGLREPEPTAQFGWTHLAMGSEVHRVLKELFSNHSQQLSDPSFAWSDEHKAELTALLSEALGSVLARAPTQVEMNEVRRWSRTVGTVLDVDSHFRAHERSVPIRLEHSVAGEIAGLRVYGKADRVDQKHDGSIIVLDYKTGKKQALKANKDDPTLGGRRIQALIYAELVTAELNGDRLADGADPQALYWFFGEGPQKMSSKIELDEDVRAALESWLQLGRKMMQQGIVPMFPRESSDQGLCGHCPYTSICPQNRQAIVARQADRAEGVLRKFFEMQEMAPDPQADLGDEAALDGDEE